MAQMRTDLWGTASMGTILVETGSIWQRIFLLDRVTASEEQKAGRDIVMLFFGALVISSEACRKIDRAKLDLRHQLKMLSLWTQYRQNAPLMPVLNFAAALLSRDDRQL